MQHSPLAHAASHPPRKSCLLVLAPPPQPPPSCVSLTIQAAPSSLIYLVAMPSYTYHTCSTALQPMLPPIHLVMPACCTTTSTTTIVRVHGHPGRTTIAIYLVAMPSYTYHTCSAALQPMLPPIHLVMPACSCTTTSTTTIMRVHDIQAAPPSLIYLVAMPSYTFTHAAQPSSPCCLPSTS